MSDMMQKIVSLCKRRGFVFQSSEIYGGLKSAYDYGPLGAELKRNIMNAWWRNMVHSRENVVGIDASIIMHPKVWEASGHLAGFADPLVDCKICKERFRADNAPTITPGSPAELSFPDKGAAKLALSRIEEQFGVVLERRGKTLVGATAGEQGYVCPICGSPFLSDERQFNLMFKTSIGATDSMGAVAAAIEDGSLTELRGQDLRSAIEELIKPSAVYLRPETAQAMFVQFANVQKATSLKVPFGIAQMGKSFRNEITVEHFIFRSCEFEQMEIEFFCHPDQSQQWYQYWRDRRMQWYTDMGLDGERLQLREHDEDELSHYSTGTADIEYAFPFMPPGEYGELEGIAHRGDFDLRSHMEGKLDPNTNPLEVETNEHGQPKWRGSGKDLSYRDDLSGEKYVPHVIEPSAGADRATLAFLCEAYTEDEVPDEKGNMQVRTVMKFHPRLAPIKAAVFPLVKKDGMPEVAKKIYSELKPHFNVFYDEKGAVGRRYRRQDEAGTPYCITVDGQTLDDNTVTIRDRDSLVQDRIPVDQVVKEIQDRLQS